MSGVYRANFLSRLLFLLVVVSFVLLTAAVSFAAQTSSSSLFTPLRLRTSLAGTLGEERFNQLRRLQSDPATLALEVVSAQPDLLKGAPEIVISGFGFSLSFRTREVDERGENDWTWVGEREDGYAVLVIHEGKISGTVYSSDLTFSVLPLDTGYAALRIVNPSDVLPEYAPLLEDTQVQGEWVPAPVVENGLTYTVIVFYTTAAANYVTGTLLQSIQQHAQQAVSESNLTYANSLIGTGGTPMKAELAGALVTNYSETHNDALICNPNPAPCNKTGLDLDRLAGKTDGYMDEVHGLRDKLGADVVILMSLVNDTGGLATLNASESTAFGQVRVQQGTGVSYTFAHEVGHIEGASHNAEQNALDSATPAYSYGQGYGGPGSIPAGRTWATVMSYSSSTCSPACSQKAPHFSNPNVNFGGAPTGDPTTADNARVLNERKQTVANFRHGTGALAVAPVGIRVAQSEDFSKFGHAVAGTNGYTQTVTLTNTSTTAYSITAVSSSSGDFTVLNFVAGSLSPGASMAFDLRFNPTAVGLRSSMISVSHTSGGLASPFTFNAIGRGAEAAAAINPSSPIPLPGHDGTTAGLLSSTLNSVVIGTISELRVNVDLDPLSVYWSSLILKHPDGTTIDLYRLGTSGPNPGWGTKLEQTQFAGVGPTTFTAGSSPYSAVFRPAEALSGLNGKAKNGTWTLEVRSYVVGGGGPGLYGWSIQFGPGGAPNESPNGTITDPAGDLLKLKPNVVYTFKATASDPDGTIASNTWDWGGAKANDSTGGGTFSQVMTSFPSYGDFPVRFIPTDNSGTADPTPASFTLRIADLSDHAFFVRQVYLDFLNREPDTGGFNYWLGELNAGRRTRAEVCYEYFKSAEFQGNGAYIGRLYMGIMFRRAEFGGFNYWLGELRSGNRTKLEILSQFINSPEFQSKFGGSLTNREFVRRLFLNILEREPDQAGSDFWTGKLDSNEMTRAEVAWNFVESPEFIAKTENSLFIQLEYFGLLRREAEDGGYNYWLSEFNGGRSKLDLINLFLSSEEYRLRFEN